MLVFFSTPQAHMQPTFQNKRWRKKVGGFSWQLKQKKHCGSPALFTPSCNILPAPILFALPQLIHIVTPFNRGQAVKDPITEVKPTFHIFSVDVRAWTTDFMWMCIEIGGEFMRGVEWRRGEEGRRWRGCVGKVVSEWKGQTRESARASSVNVIARM